MQVAVISDAHAKLTRLEATLNDIENVGADEIWCLGDLVGYGDEIEPVVGRIRAEADLVLAGNHDLAATGQLEVFLEYLPYWLKGSLLKVGEALGDDDYAWLKGLCPAGRAQGIDLYHGSAAEPIMGMLDSAQTAYWHLEAQNGPISLVGHSHQPMALKFYKDRPRVVVPAHDQKINLGDERWILNPGTCGLANRAPDRRSGWMLLDVSERTALWRRVDA